MRRHVAEESWICHACKHSHRQHSELNSVVAEGNVAKDVEEHGCVNYSPILQNPTSLPAQLASGCGESELECQVIFKTGKQMETSSLHFPAFLTHVITEINDTV